MFLLNVIRKSGGLILLAVLFFISSRANAQQFWQKVSLPAYADMAAGFKHFPSVYAESVTWGWNGTITRGTIAADLDSLKVHGLLVATIEAGYNMPAPYPSPQPLKLAAHETKFIVIGDTLK